MVDFLVVPLEKQRSREKKPSKDKTTRRARLQPQRSMMRRNTSIYFSPNKVSRFSLS